MHWTRSAVTAGLLALVMVACGPSGPSETELAHQAEWSWLQEAKQELDGMRQEVAELRAQAAAAATAEEGEAEGGSEGEVEGEAAEAAPTAADLAALEAQVAAKTEEFTTRLVGFLNDDPMIEGEPPSERQLSALRLKSDEDMVLAQEWIDKGGDYKRAIDIYQTALRFDPDNDKLQAGLAKAEADRYMSRERFEQAKKGMYEDEVRAVLGQVNLHNVREFPDRKVVAWFYPTSESGTAAAVWFREDEKGKRVYRLNYEEVKREEAAAS